MWVLLLISMSLLALVGAVYLVVRFHRFSFIAKIAEKNRFLSWIAAIALVSLTAFFLLYNVYTFVVVLVHLVLITLLVQLIGFIIRKASKKKIRFDLLGFISIALTALYIGAGFFAAYHVFRTDYTLSTSKSLSKSLRIVEIADSHLGITLDGKSFSDQVDRINEQEPDVVVVVGDFVDDDSPKSDMLEAVAALCRLKTTYGVYFVFGNHDDGYFNYRDYTGAELRSALRDAGVIVLEDESVLVNNEFYIIGRKDRSSQSRLSAEKITNGLDTDKYMILLDHQPNDYDNEAATGVDLVLSGHTHGGHIFPAGLIGLAMKANDRVYGEEVRGDTTFIVTSGISGWAIPIKTGTFSEFVVIDVIPE